MRVLRPKRNLRYDLLKLYDRLPDPSQVEVESLPYPDRLEVQSHRRPYSQILPRSGHDVD